MRLVLGQACADVHACLARLDGGRGGQDAGLCGEDACIDRCDACVHGLDLGARGRELRLAQGQPALLLIELLQQFVVPAGDQLAALSTSKSAIASSSSASVCLRSADLLEVGCDALGLGQRLGALRLCL